MIQEPLFEIKPVERNKYLVLHKKKTLEAWYMGETFIFPNYRQEKEYKILEHLGNMKQVFDDK